MLLDGFLRQLSNQLTGVIKGCSMQLRIVCSWFLCLTLLTARGLCLSLQEQFVRDALLDMMFMVKSSHANIRFVIEELQEIKATELQEQESSCPRGFVKHEQSCYHLSVQRMTRDQAVKSCDMFGANLVAIDSQSENEFIQDQIKNITDRRNTGYWTDGVRVIQTRAGPGNLRGKTKFRWQNSKLRDAQFGRTVPDAYHDFHRNEPNGNGDCVAIVKNRSFQWADEKCSQSHGYICEKRLF